MWRRWGRIECEMGDRIREIAEGGWVKRVSMISRRMAEGDEVWIC